MKAYSTISDLDITALIHALDNSGLDVNDSVRVRLAAMLEGATLDSIALSLDPVPDKATNAHGYAPYYETYFAPFRKRPIRLLEIGVWEGASMALWSVYFPKAMIYGADVDIKRCKRPLPARVTLWEADQSNGPSLENMAREIGPWDIIIDDGSHDPRHQILTYETLWPYLRKGGLYCVEDLHPNYKAYADVKPGFVDYLGTTIQADLHGHGKTSVSQVSNNRPEELALLTARELEIRAIHLYRCVAIIEKV